MITIDKYLNNPTKTLHCTFNQYKTRASRRNEVIVPQDKFNENDYHDYFDTTIVRMKHDLNSLTSSKMGRGLSFITFTEDVYEDEKKFFVDDFYFLLKEIFSVSDEEFSQITKKIKDNDYSSELCFILYINRHSKKAQQKRLRYPVGVCYATMDQMIGEATIDKFGILPEFRNKGYGKIILQELLLRLANLDAKFITVALPCYEDHILERLFHSCGFTDDYVWHILKKNTLF